MVSERAIFSISGPQHKAIDWRNTFHRRSVAASLVQGVYILERDRQQGLHGPELLATPWWETFHFHLQHVLVDSADVSFFGAIYELKFPPPHFNRFGQAPQDMSLLLEAQSQKAKLDDFKLNFKFICNKLDDCSCFKLAMQEVENLVAHTGAANVWLTGHSLGAAIALLAGKTMAKAGHPLETYLFNPPFPSAPIEKIKSEKLKHGVRFTSSLMTAGLAVAVHGRGKKPQHEDQFVQLSQWAPYIFVNPSDPVCAKYIGYFEHRNTMAKIGAGQIKKLAIQHSFGKRL